MTPFKDLKSGYPIFILETKDEINVKQGNVLNVSKPYFNTTATMTNDMMVDVTISVDGDTKTYSFKDNTDAGFDNTKGQIISTGRELIIRELESMRATSEQALKQVEKHRSIVEKCTATLSDFNPTEKEKKQFDERITRIEQSNEQITKMLTQILNNQRAHEGN